MEQPAHRVGSGRTIWVRSLLTCAGLLGLGGVALGAAGTHVGGGDLARLASTFLLLHAAAVIGVAAYAAATGSQIVCVAGAIFVVGVVAFSGDVASMAFRSEHLMPGLAPIGGTLLFMGWLALAVTPWLKRRQAEV